MPRIITVTDKDTDKNGDAYIKGSILLTAEEKLAAGKAHLSLGIDVPNRAYCYIFGIDPNDIVGDPTDLDADGKQVNPGIFVKDQLSVDTAVIESKISKPYATKDDVGQVIVDEDGNVVMMQSVDFALDVTAEGTWSRIERRFAKRVTK